MLMHRKAKTNELIYIDAARITINPNHPRKSFDMYELSRLAESLRLNGLLQPLIVKREKDEYILLSGERRLRAAIIAGFITVPCILLSKEGNASSFAPIVENAHRRALNIFEEAEAIAELLAKGEFSQQEAAEQLGISPSTLSNKLRILKLNEGERRRFNLAGLSERHARALIRIADPQKREGLLDKIIDDELNSSKTEELIEAYLKGEKAPKPLDPLFFDERIIENSLSKIKGSLLRAGILAITEREEKDEFLQYIIKIRRINR